MREDEASLRIFFISVSTEKVTPRVPAAWNDYYVPVVPAGRSVPCITQLIKAFDSRSAAIVSEVEEEGAPTPPPAPLAEAPGNQRAADAARRVNFAGARPSTSPDSRGMPSDPTGALAGAGLGRRQISPMHKRIFCVYTRDSVVYAQEIQLCIHKRISCVRDSVFRIDKRFIRLCMH